MEEQAVATKAPVVSSEPETLEGDKEIEPTERSISVKTNRKAALLLEARADRIAWVQSVPLPYAITTNGEPVSLFNESHAVRQLPSASKVIAVLYREGEGISKQEIDERVDALVRLKEIYQNSKDDHNLAVPNGYQILQTEIFNAEGPQEDMLRAYRDFFAKLQLPESATLVQGMRGFLQNLRDSSHDAVAKSLRLYLESTLETIKTHPAFCNENDFAKVRRSLHSFVFGQGYDTIWSTIDASQDELNLQRWKDLDFLNAEHFDIPCLAGRSPDDLEKLLKEPISAITSLEQFYSPYEKLQCILKAFHGINASLSLALNQKGSSTKLPSADDILPTLILTLLRAKPKAVASNLAMIEVFGSPDHLRGEAGYAYTNLFGAVQFLLDLDLDKDPEKLTISAEEFRKGLEMCRAEAEDKLVTKINQADTEMLKISQWTDMKIPLADIRAARLGGAVIDVAWAKQWYEANGHTVTVAGEPTGSEEAQEILPSGFTRSYTFLTTRPDEIRVSDLPQLLAEYRMLVHTTEVLLGERSSRQAVERKHRFAEEQKRLEEEALDAELILELRKYKV